MPETPSVFRIFLVFLRLGSTSFGGPAVHIAQMRGHFVSRHQWVSERNFLDLLAVANTLPGPSSTELALLLGYSWRGWRGLLAAGCGFILPSAFLMAALAHFYRLGYSLVILRRLLLGIEPVVVAVVAHAWLALAPRALSNKLLAAIGLGALVAVLASLPLLPILVVAALVAWCAGSIGSPTASTRSLVPLLSIPWLNTPKLTLFFTFFKAGSLVFGSGYVLIAFLRKDVVTAQHWLTESQLLDAIALGQVTPGPVFSTATFIGYFVDGPQGAVLATLGIFIPAFILVAISGRLLPAMRSHPQFSRILDGLSAASLGMMAASFLLLGRDCLTDLPAIATFLVALALLWRYALNPAWLLLASAIAALVRLH